MNPSLLLIPDRYKAAKLYSQIPDSGTGDLTFARNSNATRVNSAGLIEKVRTNLLQQSQNLAAAAWSLIGTATRTANYGTAPDGTQTSTRIQWTSANSFELFQYTGVAAPVYGSVFIKGTAGETIKYTGNSVTLNGSWQRIEGAIAIDGSNTFFTIVGTAGVNTAFDFELWGAQAEAGDIATPYIPTTTAAVSVGITADIPRLDYTGGGCPSLLLEPQRTNLVTFSEQFDNAAWNKISSSVTANTTISPDGFTNADTIAFTASADARCEIGLSGVFESQSHTVSVYAKVASGTGTFRLKCTHSSIDDYYSSDLTATTEWQRFTFTQAFGASVGSGINFGIINGTNALAKNVIFYGFQTEINASYATSYIPTLGSSVTRLADAASKTGISSLIGTEFTIFYDGVETTGGQATRYLVLKGSGGTYANAVFIEGSSSNTLALTVLNNSSLSVFSAISPSLTNGQRMKFAVRCKDNDFAFYVNGSLVAAQASGSVPTTADLYLGYYVDNADNYSLPTTAAIYTSGLSNAELATLTAL